MNVADQGQTRKLEEKLPDNIRSQEIEVKNLDEGRWEEFRDLRLESLKGDLIAFGSSFDEEKDMPEGEWRRRIKNTLFALVNDNPVGMITCIRNKKIKTRHVANIYGYYVKEEYRGRGVGDKLIDSAIKKIRRNRDVIKISLAVNPEQKAAVRLYQKHGFEITGWLKKEIKVEDKYYDELIMEKKIGVRSLHNT